jgi:hypothetical protein
MPAIHQAPDHLELVDLVEWIKALVAMVTQWCRKAIASFPDAQGVLGETGVALHRGDAAGTRPGAAGEHFAGRGGTD